MPTGLRSYNHALKFCNEFSTLRKGDISRNEQKSRVLRLVQFIDSYDPPLKGLHEDLNFVSPRIGEVLEAVGPIIFLSTDTRKLRNEGFLSPFHPRYPDILTNSAHPMRAQDLANVTSYQEWVLLGYLVCPDELLRVTSIDIALVVLKENLVLTLFRDEYVLLHEDYQLYVLPRMLESKKMAKSGRTKQKEADLEYIVAKQVKKMIRVAGHWNWRFAFFGEAIVMVPFAILGFVIKPLQLKGFYPAGSKKALTGTEIAVIELKGVTRYDYCAWDLFSIIALFSSLFSVYYITIM
ncbi:hypothetical protein CsSME_00004347 [Camellia sinensis var. sinensis]